MDILDTSAAETAAILTPMVLGIVTVIATATNAPSRLKPLIALAIGVGLAFLLNEDLTLRGTILAGLLGGLSAAGTYSGTKAVVEG